MVAPASGSPDELPIDVEMIKVLASDTRRDILRLLGERQRTLTEIADALNLKKATILEHLQKLQDADLIRRLEQQERLWIYYELTPRGKRLVRPERTRFFLILGGTAAAALVLGAILAAATLMNFGDPAGDAAPEASAPEAILSSQSGLRVPPAVWRGLDATVPLTLDAAPPDARLVVRSDDGVHAELPLQDGRAQIDATLLDSLAAGTYRLGLATSVGEAPLPEPLVVHDPTIAVFPLAVTAGTPHALEIALVPPGLPSPAPPEMRIDGAPVHAPIVNATGGTARLEIGRIFATDVRILPAFELAIAREADVLKLVVTEAGAPLPGAQLFIDADAIGTTDEAGALDTPWPAEGEHALRIVAADGRTQERALRFAQDVSTLEPRLRLQAFHATPPGADGFRIHAEIENLGRVPETVTLAGREGNALLASGVADVPPGARVTVLLASGLARPVSIDVTAHAARAPDLAFTRESDARADGAPPPPAPAAAPAAYDAEAAKSSAYGFRSEAFAADARVTLVVVTTPAAANGGDAQASARAEPAAAVPGVAPLAAIALAALAAAALRRRR